MPELSGGPNLEGVSLSYGRGDGHRCPQQMSRLRNEWWKKDIEPLDGTMGECEECGRLWIVHYNGSCLQWFPLRWYHFGKRRLWKEWEALS